MAEKNKADALTACLDDKLHDTTYDILLRERRGNKKKPKHTFLVLKVLRCLCLTYCCEFVAPSSKCKEAAQCDRILYFKKSVFAVPFLFCLLVEVVRGVCAGNVKAKIETSQKARSH